LKKYVKLIILLGILAVTFTMIFFSTSSVKGLSGNTQLSLDLKTPEQTGPPWFDDAWQYRRQVSITNSGAPLGYYQVLLKLDDNNFDFNLTNADGSDIRFTHSDGTTELSYWIESWDYSGMLAYIWIKVPSLANGETTIYLYYHNPNAVTTSRGTTTFDGFENDWSQFSDLQTSQDELIYPQSSAVIENPFIWSSIGIPPSVTSGILSLSDGSGVKSTSPYLYNAIGMRVNFISGTGNKWGGFINGATGQRTMIGDLASDPDNLYLLNSRSDTENILIPRNSGADWHNSFHVYEVGWSQNLSMGDIDHGLASVTSSQPNAVPNTYLPVTLYSYLGSNAELWVDWIYLRQYREPEPSLSLGEPQSLINLGLSMIDSPDPLPTGRSLTYQLSITNPSSIAAPGVVVTDTLPIEVSFSSVDPSQGSCVSGGVVVCNMGVVPAYSSANIELVVIPAMDGKMTNTAIVGSLGYDMDMSDNWDDTDTLVDSIPPNVNWESPVHNGEEYTTSGEMIILEASATDNDQVDWVEFWWWDHLPIDHPRGKVSIGYDYAYPYQMQFDSTVLLPNQEYQVFVQAADRAGNVSDIYVQPYPRIFITRILKYFFYLPISEK
jgi:uncharacterized repeat protein (TIGR01451 family)